MKSDICLIRSDLELSSPDFILDISVSILSWIVSIVVSLFNGVQQIILEETDGNHRNVKGWICKVLNWKFLQSRLLIIKFFLLTLPLFTLLKGVVIFRNRDNSLSSDSSVSPSWPSCPGDQFSIYQNIKYDDHLGKWLELRVLWEIDLFPIVRIPLWPEGEGWLRR